MMSTRGLRARASATRSRKRAAPPSRMERASRATRVSARNGGNPYSMRRRQFSLSRSAATPAFSAWAASSSSEKSPVESVECTWGPAGSRSGSAALAGETPERSDTTIAATRTFRRPTLGGAALAVPATTVSATIAPSPVRASRTGLASSRRPRPSRTPRPDRSPPRRACAGVARRARAPRAPERGPWGPPAARAARTLRPQSRRGTRPPPRPPRGVPAHRRADGGNSERHRFDERPSHPFVPRRGGEHVRRRQVLQHVPDGAGHVQAVGDAELDGAPFERGALGPLADEQETRRRHVGAETRQRLDEQVEPLDRHETPEPGDDVCPGRDPEARAGLLPGRRAGTQPLGRDAARHRHELRTASDTTRQVLLRPALREGDDPVAPRGRQPLERRVDGGAQPAPVPVEDVAVGLVDDGGHPGDPRRAAADEAALPAVRVDDLRPRGRDEAGEPGERHHVRDERNLAAQRRHVDEPAPTPAGVPEDRGVGLPEGDRGGPAVARAPEPPD